MIYRYLKVSDEDDLQGWPQEVDLNREKINSDLKVRIKHDLMDLNTDLKVTKFKVVLIYRMRLYLLPQNQDLMAKRWGFLFENRV